MVEKKIATCPTCNQTSEFDYLGKQHWPPELARKLGLPEVIELWSCGYCHTTVSEPDLLPARSGLNSKPEASPHLS